MSDYICKSCEHYLVCKHEEKTRTSCSMYLEVVRCKDCKWYRITPIDNVPYCCHESGYCGEHMKGLFFCACGERKDT